MAKMDAAALWLKEQADRRVEDAYGTGRDRSWRMPKGFPIYPDHARRAFFAEPLERQAHAAQVKMGNRFSLRKFAAIGEFLSENRSFDEDRCLFFPNAYPPVRASVIFNGSTMDAARAMCLMVNGPAPYDDAVARHLCGNGHWSCVNPKHLAWGTPEDNAQDRVLHRTYPDFWPDISDDALDVILEDPRLPNVIAIEFGIHACVVREIKAGNRMTFADGDGEEIWTSDVALVRRAEAQLSRATRKKKRL